MTQTYHFFEQDLYRITKLKEAGSFLTERYVSGAGFINDDNFLEVRWNGTTISKRDAEAFILESAQKQNNEL